MKKLATRLCCAFMLCSTSMTFATEKAGGCGIGKEIMAEKTGLGSNLIASMLNALPIPNTFFMTTGILGCDTTQTVQNEQQSEIFVARNMDTLAIEIAQGNGDHLAALATLLGVADADKPVFYSLAKDQYEPLFNTIETSPVTVLTALNTAMLNDTRLSQYATQ